MIIEFLQVVSYKTLLSDVLQTWKEPKTTIYGRHIIQIQKTKMKEKHFKYVHEPESRENHRNVHSD